MTALRKFYRRHSNAIGLGLLVLPLAVKGVEFGVDKYQTMSDPVVAEGRIVVPSVSDPAIEVVRRRTDEMLAGMISVERIFRENKVPVVNEGLAREVAFESISVAADGNARAELFDAMDAIATAAPHPQEVDKLVTELNGKRDLLRKAAFWSRAFAFAISEGDTDTQSMAMNHIESLTQAATEIYPELAEGDRYLAQLHTISSHTKMAEADLDPEKRKETAVGYGRVLGGWNGG